MPSVEARQSLAAEQAALVRALAGLGEPPEGFDSARLGVAAEALGRKRLRAVARAWHRGWPAPLGSSSRRAPPPTPRATPLPRLAGHSPTAERSPGRWPPLPIYPTPDGSRPLAVDLHHIRRPDGLVSRRVPALAAGLLRRPRRFVLAIRIPRLGEGWFRVPVGLTI
jgi:hypothetical protein